MGQHSLVSPSKHPMVVMDLEVQLIIQECKSSCDPPTTCPFASEDVKQQQEQQKTDEDNDNGNDNGNNNNKKKKQSQPQPQPPPPPPQQQPNWQQLTCISIQKQLSKHKLKKEQEIWRKYAVCSRNVHCVLRTVPLKLPSCESCESYESCESCESYQTFKLWKLRNFRSVRSFRSVHSFRSFHSVRSFRSVPSFRSVQAAVKLSS